MLRGNHIRPPPKKGNGPKSFPRNYLRTSGKGVLYGHSEKSGILYGNHMHTSLPNSKIRRKNMKKIALKHTRAIILATLLLIVTVALTFGIDITPIPPDIGPITPIPPDIGPIIPIDPNIIIPIDPNFIVLYTPITLSSGLFGLPANAASVDWMVVNDSMINQTITVTVYRSGLGGKVVVPPGAITTTIAPWGVTHNANSVGYSKPFKPGFYYEVIVETNHPNVLPSVHVWQDHYNTVIPGTLIPPGCWVKLK